jgi:hypothetical protein
MPTYTANVTRRTEQFASVIIDATDEEDALTKAIDYAEENVNQIEWETEEDEIEVEDVDALEDEASDEDKDKGKDEDKDKKDK